MFSIKLNQCNNKALQKSANQLIQSLQEAKQTNAEQAFEIWAFIKAASNMLEAVVDNQKESMCDLFKERYPLGEDTVIGNYVFRVTDKPDYNYANHDDDGRFKVLSDQIAINKEEGKRLTKRINDVKAQILENHPSMVPQHHYSLTYSGTTEDGKSKLVV